MNCLMLKMGGMETSANTEYSTCAYTTRQKYRTYIILILLLLLLLYVYVCKTSLSGTPHSTRKQNNNDARNIKPCPFTANSRTHSYLAACVFFSFFFRFPLCFRCCCCRRLLFTPLHTI